MTFDKFDKFQAELLAEVVGMKNTKGKEYAHTQDRFANFRRLSAELEIPDYVVCWVYLKKHLDSIASFAKEGRTFSTESIRGRFVDAIVYLTLMAGMVDEKNGGHNTGKQQPMEYTPDHVVEGAAV